MGQSQRELRTRIKSVESTMHITRAMELVSSSKFKKAYDTLEKGKSYFELLDEAFSDISAYAKDSPYFTKRNVKNRTFIVIAGDRGLVGSFNNSLYKLVDEIKDEAESKIIPFGKKAVEHYKYMENSEVISDFLICDKITEESIKNLSAKLSKDYISGKTDEVFVVYTKYVNMMTQEPSIEKILPITPKDDNKKTGQMMFEPNPSLVLASAVPEYIFGGLYGALCESLVSENAARRMSMDSATKNAGEIIDNLTLAYNRARQSAITQEITEIIAGSEN